LPPTTAAPATGAVTASAAAAAAAAADDDADAADAADANVNAAPLFPRRRHHSRWCQMPSSHCHRLAFVFNAVKRCCSQRHWRH
jgi:hypothetical protein